MNDALQAVSSWADGIGPVLQALLLLVVGAVPFLESYIGAPLGVLFGISLPVAVAIPVLGNTAAIVLAGVLGRRVRGRQDEVAAPSARRQKIMGRVDRWGVPVASLLAPLVLAISLTAFIMVAAGLDSRRVVVWNVVASVVWGAAFAGLLLGAVVVTD